jgi:hypothetical protein
MKAPEFVRAKARGAWVASAGAGAEYQMYINMLHVLVRRWRHHLRAGLAGWEHLVAHPGPSPGVVAVPLSGCQRLTRDRLALCGRVKIS